MPKILIIGQGIAGSVLAWTLLQQGAQVHIADDNQPGSASIAAAGIINPVTGKRFVKSWRFETFFPVARAVYQEMEQALGISIWEEKPIIRLLATAEEANDWSARCALPDYTDYLDILPDAGKWLSFVKPGFQFGAILQAARVNFGSLLAAFRKTQVPNLHFLEKTIDYQEVGKLTQDYDYVIFSEGYRSQGNPFFPNLPWQIAKGEALLIRFQDERALHIHEMLKKTMTLVPLGDGLFWAGGSYQWHYPDLAPSAGERDFILNHLQQMLAVPFEIVGHVAGVRPTVKDRRPFLGQSPIHPKVIIFNGLGTKGALLAPYWAQHLAAHILKGKELDREVAVGR